MPTTTAATTLTRPEKITILKHLINGRETDFITAATGNTTDQVSAVKRDHGYPDEDKMRWALDILDKQADTIPTSLTDADREAARGQLRERPATTPAPIAPASTVVRPKPAPAPVQPPSPRHYEDLIAPLVTRGRASAKARTRTLADKVADHVARLVAVLDDEEAAARAAEQAAKEEAERQAKIAALKAELEALGATAPKKSRPKGERSNRIARGEYPCPGCDRVLDTPQGLSAHRRRAHEGWNPQTVTGDAR